MVVLSLVMLRMAKGAYIGYAGESPSKKTSYDGWEMTSKSKAQLERIFWWYFTDCYPFKKTQRKGGWGVSNGGLFEMIKKK